MSTWRSSNPPIIALTARIKAIAAITASRSAASARSTRCGVMRLPTPPSRRSSIISPFTPIASTRSKNRQRPKPPLPLIFPGSRWQPATLEIVKDGGVDGRGRCFGVVALLGALPLDGGGLGGGDGSCRASRDRILRFWNDEVPANRERVHGTITKKLSRITPARTLPHHGGGLFVRFGAAV